jgi:hypothetical protein
MGQVRYEYVDKDGQRIVKEIHKVVVHTFRMGDVEDPDLYASEPLMKWQDSDEGKFVLEHAVETPIWQKNVDNVNWGWQFVIIAELEKKKLSEYYLRFDKVKI